MNLLKKMEKGEVRRIYDTKFQSYNRQRLPPWRWENDLINKVLKEKHGEHIAAGLTNWRNRCRPSLCSTLKKKRSNG